MHADLELQRSLARLMRELPDEQPYDFREFQWRAARRAAARGASAGRQALAAAAAVIAVALVALYLRLAGAHLDTRAPTVRPGTPDLPLVAAGVPAEQRAEAMEHWLASMPGEPALVRVGTRAAVTGLEDRIAQIDDLLSAARAEQAQPARLSALQEQRTQLVGALVQVRYAETLADATR